LNKFFVHKIDCYIDLNLYLYKISPSEYKSYISTGEVIF